MVRPFCKGNILNSINLCNILNNSLILRSGCFLYVKDTNLKANHNDKYVRIDTKLTFSGVSKVILFGHRCISLKITPWKGDFCYWVYHLSDFLFLFCHYYASFCIFAIIVFMWGRPCILNFLKILLRWIIIRRERNC